MKIYYATFTDDRYKPTRDKAKKQAEGMGLFDKVYALSEHDFDPEFKELFYKEHRNKMLAFGYYCWQPWTDMHVLDLMEDGDFLFYSDAGNTLNPNGKKRFMEWISMISSGDKDILGILDSERLECQYTKEDVFNYFGIDKNSSIRETGQYFLGALLLRKTPSSYALIKKWYDINCNHLEIVDETVHIPNEARFKAFRYGQSVISVMLKNYKGVVNIDSNEVYQPNRSIKGIENAPFWAFRDKSLTLKTNIYLFPKRVINVMCDLLGVKRPFKYKM